MVRLERGVIPNARVFSSGRRDLASGVTAFAISPS